MVQPMRLLSFLYIIIIIFFLPLSVTAIYNVVKLGAKPDGRSDSTQAFLNAWAGACGSVSPAMIYVPPGRFLLNHVHFEGNCNNSDISIRIDGTLVAPSDYRVMGSAESWLLFEEVSGVSILGGTLDGQGARLWACKDVGKKCPEGATNLGFTRSKDIVISGLTSLNSKMFHIVINGCQNVNMQGVMITASGNSPNTDGIHVQLSTGVKIMSTGIKTGDDCISIGAGTKNLWIEKVACGPGHGISIGSLGKDLQEPGVQNVTVKTVTFTGTQNGLRMKSWGRPSTGFVKGVLFQDVIMKNVEHPIVIDQNYCPSGADCPRKVSGINISQVTYKNIRGTSTTAVAVKFDCSAKYPCRRIILENVNLTYRNQPAQSSCTNADGTAYGLVEPKSCF